METRRSRRRRGTRRSGDNDESPKVLQALQGILEATESNVRGTKSGVPDVPRLRLKMKPYSFTRMTTGVTLSATTGVPLATGLTFSIDQLPAYTDFTNFFDQYRILQVRVTLAPGALGANSVIYSAIDYDDANVPITQSDLLERETCQITSSSIFLHRDLVPATLNQVYQSNVTTGYSVKHRQWIDSQNVSVPHYGLKLFSPTVPSGSTANTWLMVAEYSIQGRFAA